MDSLLPLRVLFHTCLNPFLGFISLLFHQLLVLHQFLHSMPFWDMSAPFDTRPAVHSFEPCVESWKVLNLHARPSRRCDPAKVCNVGYGALAPHKIIELVLLQVGFKNAI